MLHEPLKLDIELRELMFSLLGSSLLAVESSLAVAPFLHAGMGMLILVHCITKSHSEEIALSLQREFMKSRDLSI